MNAKILLVEDDPNLGFVIKDNLCQKGYEVTLCADGEEGQRLFMLTSFDLCILDVMLPRKDGFALAQHIRSINQHVPILFVTAKSMLEDKISAFQLGGDDYLTKPFSMEELLLRIEVFLRRSNGVPPKVDGFYSLGSFQFDCHNLTLHHPRASRALHKKKLTCSSCCA